MHSVGYNMTNITAKGGSNGYASKSHLIPTVKTRIPAPVAWTPVSDWLYKYLLKTYTKL